MSFMTNITTQRVFEKTGESHNISIDYGYGRYEINVDDNFYATAETRREADEEVIDIIDTYNWLYVSPFYF